MKKKLCNRRNVRDFAMALRARKVFGAFKKRAPGFTDVMGRSDSPLFLFSRTKETKVTESFFLG